MNDKIGTYRFATEPFHTDFSGRLTLGVLGNHLLNCASLHAQERGFGMGTVNEESYTWVLSRLAIEMEEMPRQNEVFRIDTWVEGVYRLFTDRNYAILDNDGRPLGYARSVWAMINMHTRKPVDLLGINGGSITDYVCEHPCPIAKPSRIKVHGGEEAATLRARYSDIDLNGHVNSIRYIEHILDLFPLDLYRRQRIRRFEMAYVAESYYDDTLSFLCQQPEAREETYSVEVRKNGTETVCRAQVEFGQPCSHPDCESSAPGQAS